MEDTDTQFVDLLRRTEPRVRRPLAVLTFLTGVVLVAHALSLGWYRPGMFAGVPFGRLLPGFQLVLGLVLSSVAVLARRGAVTPATGVTLAVGVLVLAVGPSSPLTLGLVFWTVLAGVTLGCVGLPALALVAVDTGRLVPQDESVASA